MLWKVDFKMPNLSILRTNYMLRHTFDRSHMQHSSASGLAIFFRINDNILGTMLAGLIKHKHFSLLDTFTKTFIEGK